MPVGPQIDVSDVVIGFSTMAVTRTRYAAGSYPQTGANRGQYVPGAQTTATITASMQPIDHRTREMLPEGIRLRATYTMWTCDDVRADQPTTSGSVTQSDWITFDSRVYQVYKDNTWPTVADGKYRRFVLVEKTAEP